jgi:hypothetical protein
MFEYMRDERGGWNLKPEKNHHCHVLIFSVIELQIFVLLYIRLVIHVLLFEGTKEVTNMKNQDQAIQI